MKYFLTILLGLIPFLSHCQVVITENTARVFLAKDDSLQVYKAKDSLCTERTTELDEEIVTLQKIIKTYQQDSTTYQQQKELLTQQNEQTIKDLKKAERRVKWIKVERWIERVGFTALIVLIAI